MILLPYYFTTGLIFLNFYVFFLEYLLSVNYFNSYSKVKQLDIFTSVCYFFLINRHVSMFQKKVALSIDLLPKIIPWILIAHLI